MGLIMNLNAASVGINAVLLAVLLVLYLRIWRQVNSRFTLGLAAFAFVLLAQCGIQLYFFATMMDYYVPGLDVLVLVQNLLMTLALVFLVFVTWSPAGGGVDTAEPAAS